jgi:NAD(P)-dependent dehydrogenase (short-subunit alcohol dehydrogenase family)
MSEHIALVVGGTSGIGLATARRLQARGATVHVVGRDKERLDQVAATDPALIGHRADGGNREEITEVIESIGRIDWLVVTLAGSEGPGPIADLDLQMLRRAFDAKFWGHLTTLQAALPHLAPNGSITLLGAITARAGMPGTAGIAAINGAVEALVKPLAVELAPIRVNGVSPGFVDSPGGAPCPTRPGGRTSTRPRRRSRPGTSPPPTTSPRPWSWRPPTTTSAARSSRPMAARAWSP